MADQTDLNRRGLLTGGALAGATSLLPAASNAEAKAVRDLDPDPFQPVPPPEPYPARERHIPVADGVSLYCWDTGGAGAPIVLFHPRTGSGLIWAYQREAFAKAGHRVIGYSRRGYADSDPGPKDNVGTGVGDLQVLLEALKVDRFHAVSTAAGGFVAADFALSHGERLLSLTLACSILGVTDAELGEMDKRLRPPFFAKLPPDFQELGPSYRAAHPDGHAKWVELHDHSTVPGQVDQPLVNTITLAALKSIKTPTLLICGDCDLIAAPPVMRAFHAAIPGSRLEVIAECGHSAYWERPGRFNDAVLAFVRTPRA